ncbi:hypothetical protein [Reyranella sp.]|uniref:hypothetical protein n=1 Tax=Reyranella sp. TaxID=1929291 RepID=UPI0037844643
MAGNMRFSRIGGQALDLQAVRPTTARPAVAAPPSKLAAPVAEARPVASVVSAAPVLNRQARLFPQARLDEARVLNPALSERLRPIRVRPVPATRPSCPAGGEHDHTGSGNYTLAINRAGLAGQSNWRWCRKCQGLAFGGSPTSVCPKGGAHDLSQSGDYVLKANVAAQPRHQSNWRWCNRCQGLAFGGQPTPGACPAGGPHNHGGSGDYLLPINDANAEGQPNWRWCRKCQGLAYAGGASGATREELALPVASSDPVDPDKLLEAPSGAARYYLPTYQLARRVVSGSEQYEIRMAPGEAGQWTLRVALGKTRPAGANDPAATELEHDLLLQLVYRLTKSDGGTITKTLEFTSLGETEDKSAVIGLMNFVSPGERDQALAAITTSGSGCGIVATRSVRVAVPIVGAAGRFRPVTRGFPQAVDPDPLFLNPQLHPYLFDGAVPHGGSGPGLVARQLQFDGRFYDYWEDAADPTRIFYLPDAFRLARRDKPSPFTPLMSVRVVAGATPEADPMIGFEFVATPWSDTRRLEAARREFAKRLPTPPGSPAPQPAPTPRSAQLGGGLAGSLGGVLGGLLGGDPRATAAAADVVGGVVGGLLGGGDAGATAGNALASLLGVKPEDERASRIRLEPVPVEKASFWLVLPGATGGGLVERPAAQIDVRTALVVSETLPMGDFQTVYDSLVGGAVAIMKGEVRCDFGGGAAGKIPLDARFDRMNGELLEPVIELGERAGAFRITLTNAVESPVQISSLNASLLIRGMEVPAAARADGTLPMQLAPGESVALMVSPLKEPPNNAEIEPMLDLSGVKPLLDSEKLWAAILDADTAAESKRTVRVKLFPGMFDAPSGNPADKAFAVIVQFDGGPSVELTPEKADAEVKLTSSVSDIVLRRASAGGYRYKCQIIRRSARLADSEWRSDTTDLLVPLLPAG